MLKLENCIWEYGKCRSCGAELKVAKNHIMPVFCCRKCTNDFGTAVYKAIREKTAAEKYGIHKCPICGRFWHTEELGGAIISLCPTCQEKGEERAAAEVEMERKLHQREQQRLSRRRADEINRKSDEMRMVKQKCHCCDRPAAPGSYWCARCKAKRNAEYHISPAAWGEAEDFTYGGPSSNRKWHLASD